LKLSEAVLRNAQPMRNGPSSKSPGPRKRPNWMRRLKLDLNSQLHVEGFAGSDTGCTVEVADRIRDRAIAVDCARAGGHVDAVEEVKHLRAELKFEPLILAKGDVLEDRKVHVSIAGAVELVASNIGRPCAVSRKVDPLHPGAGAGDKVLG